LIDRAAVFAAVSHKDQKRKSPEAEIPYLQHPYMVGLILLRAGFDDEVVAAGILHDVLEDTSTTFQELEEAFGARIAQLVSHVTEEDKSIPWERRKELHLERIRRAPIEARAIATADKIHNIRSIITSLQSGANIWSRLKADPSSQMDRFERTLSVVSDQWEHPLVAELASVLEQLRTVMKQTDQS
jgi:(p)ppGpp synthase/HD superfamily hydrolase